MDIPGYDDAIGTVLHLYTVSRKIDWRIAVMIFEHLGGCSGPQERSEEHTSELQSLMRISYAVFCLKKTIKGLAYLGHTPVCKTPARTNQTTPIIVHFPT